MSTIWSQIDDYFVGRPLFLGLIMSSKLNYRGIIVEDIRDDSEQMDIFHLKWHLEKNPTIRRPKKSALNKLENLLRGMI